MEDASRLEKVQHYLHDIKNNLLIINSHIYLYQKNNKLDVDKTKHCLDSIANQVNNAFLITKNAISFIPTALPLNELNNCLFEITEDVKLLYPHFNINFSYNLCDKDVFISYHEELLKQIVLNIFDNSKNAQSKNIRIKLKFGPDSCLLSFRDDGDVEIYGQDNTKHFHGVGQKIIVDNMKRLSGACKFKQHDQGYEVQLYFIYTRPKMN